jgi:Integrase core domain
MWSDFTARVPQECLQVHRPRTLQEVQEVTEQFLVHYNQQRPHQGRSCGNQPPRVACPAFPTLSTVPETVDPDHWLWRVHQQAFARTIRVNGNLSINRQDYYVSRSLMGQRVTCSFNAAEKCFDIGQPERHIKSVPRKRLARPVDALPGVCGVDEAGSTFRISALSAHPSEAHPGPIVMLIPAGIETAGSRTKPLEEGFGLMLWPWFPLLAT